MPTVSALVRRRHRPQVLGAAQGRGPVLTAQAKHGPASLRVDPEHRRRAPVGADHQVTDPERADRLPPGRREHLTVDGLRAPAHEGQRRHLDHPALEVLSDALGVHHVVQRVEQRAQVRVDLGHQVARQKAEALAGLDGRAREDDAVDLAARERGGRHRHRQERLAGARRADAERDRVAPDRVDVALLVDGLGRHLEVAVAPHDVLEHGARGLALVEHLRDRLDRRRADLVPALDQRRQLAHDGRTRLHRLGVAFERDHVAAQEDPGGEMVLERLEDRVLRPRQLRRHVVGELQLPSCHQFESASFTLVETRRPSARPPAASIACLIARPMSRRPWAPVAAIARSTSVASSASDSSAGR